MDEIHFAPPNKKPWNLDSSVNYQQPLWFQAWFQRAKWILSMGTAYHSCVRSGLLHGALAIQRQRRRPLLAWTTHFGLWCSCCYPQNGLRCSLSQRGFGAPKFGLPSKQDPGQGAIKTTRARTRTRTVATSDLFSRKGKYRFEVDLCGNEPPLFAYYLTH